MPETGEAKSLTSRFAIGMHTSSGAKLADLFATIAYVDAAIDAIPGGVGGIDWHGSWATITEYTEGAAVKNGGSSYICTSTHTSGSTTEPGVGASWSTVWDLIAAKGDAGANGTNGTNGTNGSAGATGSQGPQGIQGETGPPGTTDHGTQTGLSDDDHTQYALADGSRGAFIPLATSVANRLTKRNGTTGLIQDTGITVDASNNISGIGTLDCRAISIARTEASNLYLTLELPTGALGDGISTFDIRGGVYENSTTIPDAPTTNFVVSMGFNLNGSGTPVDPTKHGIGWTLENKYDVGSQELTEMHETFVPRDTAGGVTAGSDFRLSSYTISIQGNSVDKYWNVSQFEFRKPSIASFADPTKAAYFSSSPNQIRLGSGSEDGTENYWRVFLNGTGVTRMATLSSGFGKMTISDSVEFIELVTHNGISGFQATDIPQFNSLALQKTQSGEVANTEYTSFGNFGTVVTHNRTISGTYQNEAVANNSYASAIVIGGSSNPGAFSVYNYPGGTPTLLFDVDRTTGNATFLGSITTSSLAGNGAGYVAVDNNGSFSWSAGGGGGGDALVSGTLDQFANVTQTAGQTFAITASTTLNGGTHSGTNTGDNATNSQYSGLVTNATHTGDATGSSALTLATVNSNVGSFGSATDSVALTVNGKGLVTAASASTITPAIGSVTGLGTGVATFLATPSSANLASAVTDETGSGALVFATAPTFALPLTSLIRNNGETTNTPSGTTQTITLATANHQTLDLSSSTGAMTVTLTVPAGGGAAGTILVKQHGTTARGITWAVSAGTISWLGTEPTWGSDGVGKVRCVVWRYNGSILYISATDSN